MSKCPCGFTPCKWDGVKDAFSSVPETPNGGLVFQTEDGRVRVLEMNHRQVGALLNLMRVTDRPEFREYADDE